MKTLYLHIGMPKTGSSSIQETLFRMDNSSTLIRYANLGCANHGGLITSLFANNPYQWHGHRVHGRTPDEVEVFNRQNRELLLTLKDCAFSQIISGEDMWHLSLNELTRLRDFFINDFDKIVVIGYVRPPVSFMASAFQQLVKNHDLSVLEPSTLIPPYKIKFEKFDQVFGRDNVYLRKFESSALLDGDVVKDFSALIGLDIQDKDIKRVNESLSLEATAVLFAHRKYGVRYAPHKEAARNNLRLIGALASLGHRKLRFAPSLVESTLNKHRADITWMEERLGVSILDTGFDAEDSVRSEKDLLDIAVDQFAALKELVQAKALAVDAKPQRLANWVEQFRIALVGCNTQGVSPQNASSLSFFTEEELKSLEEQKLPPAMVFRLLALAFERHGLLHEAKELVDEAIKLRPDADGLRKIRERLIA